MTGISSVCVYCGTGAKVDSVYKEAAEEIGTLLAQKNMRLVYGGGRVGLMGVVSEACIRAGGAVTGIIPEHIQIREDGNTDVTELFVVDSMHTRKRMMVEKSDAFVILPGGFGTLDETFEILTWKYLELHDKPVIIVNVNGFYAPFLRMVEHLVNSGFTPEWQCRLYNVVETPSEMFDVLSSHKRHPGTDIRHM